MYSVRFLLSESRLPPDGIPETHGGDLHTKSHCPAGEMLPEGLDCTAADLREARKDILSRPLCHLVAIGFHRAETSASETRNRASIASDSIHTHRWEGIP
ncbi:hypothetical protein TUSST3_37320 [Streptomyces sp. TUS-ST3]|nr:hypothetical protein TUSST3_37320 [Streptomyces sp. TUS-ST3]